MRSQRAYRLYDPTSQRIVISRDMLYSKKTKAGIGIRSMRKQLHVYVRKKWWIMMAMKKEMNMILMFM